MPRVILLKVEPMNKKLRQLVKPAEAMGLCLVCGQHQCTCPPVPAEMITKPRRLWTIGGRVSRWSVCKCEALIAAPTAYPVKCPECGELN